MSGQGLDDILDGALEAELNEGLGDLSDLVGKGTLIRLVAHDRPDDDLAEHLYWRAFEGSARVQTTPVKILVDGKPVIAPRMVQNEQTLELSTEYPIEGRCLFGSGKHLLQPGAIPFAEDDTLTSTHPAIVGVGLEELRIRCAPVRLDAVDALGQPLPVPLNVRCGDLSLLREKAEFNPLIIWLPVGVRYDSTLGAFTVTADGSIEAAPADLADQVTLTATGLRLTLPTQPRARSSGGTAPAPDKLFLLPHRGRSVFARGERPVFTVVVPAAFPASTARVMGAAAAPAGSAPIELGTIDLPAVTTATFDSRLFRLHTDALPAGAYELWVETAAARSDVQPMTLVPWSVRGPFFTHTISVCTGLWPTTDAGLRTLYDAGLEMVAGAKVLDDRMPRLAAKVGPGLPPEAGLLRAANDELLENLLRRRLRLVDLIVTRSAEFYMEGLSYHHSFQPSVDRMIRRLQIFTQQTADYPSFWGVNYSWFPALYGYVEGGVPTDAHAHDRNVALAAALAAAGYVSPTAEELQWYGEHKFSEDPAERAEALAIAERKTDAWLAAMDFGFGRHNKLYNDAIREIRPQTAFTLFDNAGHDLMKPTRSLFSDMNAACYESYTDYGEWPMSAAFTVDWARGNSPGQPVWITMDWGTSSSGAMKSLFHAFGRGLAGGGVPMQEDQGSKELTRRGKGLRFVAQYGALSAHAVPDRRVAILATRSEQAFDNRTQYAYHAVYYHLTRLGYAPVVVADQDVVHGGLPDGVQILVIARQQQPLQPAVAAAVDDFTEGGGHLLVTKDSRVQPAHATMVDATVRHIWQMSGFNPTVHAELWQDFEDHWRQPLAAALAETGIAPFGAVDPDEGLVVGLGAGPVRYAVVIADRRGTHFSEFEPRDGLPLSLEGTGWIVRDLARQQTLATTTESGRTQVSVDLITEPATVLALFARAPAKLVVETPTTCPSGSDLNFACTVRDDRGEALGPVPLTFALIDGDGHERLRRHAAAGDRLTFPVPGLDAPAAWQLEVQELLTGLAVEVEIEITSPDTPISPVEGIADVHVVDDVQLTAFLGKPGEKLVIVEPEQAQWLPLAQELSDALQAAGGEVRLWQVRPENFDTIPMRYYPRPEDEHALSLVAAGKLIGYRDNMKPYIDHKEERNVPEKGGVTAIAPLFMVGRDCIVFAGGRLAESLRAVTPWMNTPNVPGLAQGRLVTVFSPFLANRDVVAVVANDAAGMARAAKRLAAFAAAPAVAPAAAAVAPATAAVEPAASLAPVPCPFEGYTPLRRVNRLLATAAGQAVVLMNGRQNNTVFVAADGGIAAFAVPDHELTWARLDDRGKLWSYRAVTPAAAPEQTTVTASALSADGVVDDEFVAFDGLTAELGTHRGAAAFPVAPDGDTIALGRQAGMVLGRLSQGTRHWYDDLPYVGRTFEVWTPRFPTAMVFSPDSRCLFFTMDTRPIGYENMHQRLNRPEGSESVLIDATTGERLWSLRGEPAAYACFNGFAAVSDNGEMTALVDTFGLACLVDRAGKIVVQEQVFPKATPNVFVSRPPQGVGVWLSRNGQLAAFGFKAELVLATTAGMVRQPLPELCDGAVSDDGTFAVAATLDGTVHAFDATGAALWSLETDGIAPRVAAAGDGILVAVSTGELWRVDRTGTVLSRLDLTAAADGTVRQVQRAADLQLPPAYTRYADPGTLAVAVSRLGAERIAAWTPAGQSSTVADRKFYALDGDMQLTASVEAAAFVHLVYRCGPEGRGLTLTCTTAAGSETFVLDLPTPLYRIVDVPLRPGANTIALASDGTASVAELSVWRFAWPGPNLAYVNPGGKDGGSAMLAEGTAGGGGLDGLDLSLEEDGTVFGRVKPCKIWVPNPDIDRVAGIWISGLVNPLAIVNGKRWEERLRSWSVTRPFQGEWFTEDFGKPVAMSLVATYDRTCKQSAVTSRLAVFSGLQGRDRSEAGQALGVAIDNDQFWRLFAFPETRVSVLGVHAYSGDDRGEGLSEVEAYR